MRTSPRHLLYPCTVCQEECAAVTMPPADSFGLFFSVRTTGLGLDYAAYPLRHWFITSPPLAHAQAR